MAMRELTTAEIEALVGTRHGVTGIIYPPAGLQPYYEWLIQTLHRLAEGAAASGALRVERDDSSPTAIAIASGRVTIGGDALSYAGGALDLATFNNDTACVWLCKEGGVAVIGVASSRSDGGWPSGSHIKLAEVTVEAGTINAILDRRGEMVFNDAIVVAQDANSYTDRAITALNLGTAATHATGDFDAAGAAAAAQSAATTYTDAAIAVLHLGDAATHAATDFDAAGAAAAAQSAATTYTDTAIASLHLGDAATHAATDFDAAGAAAAAQSTATTYTDAAIAALHLGDAATHAATDFDAAGAAAAAQSAATTYTDTAIASLHLGDAATHAASDFDAAGTAAGAAAAAQSAATAYTDTAIAALNLGDAATHAATDFDPAGAASDAQAAAEAYTDTRLAGDLVFGADPDSLLAFYGGTPVAQFVSADLATVESLGRLAGTPSGSRELPSVGAGESAGAAATNDNFATLAAAFNELLALVLALRAAILNINAAREPD